MSKPAKQTKERRIKPVQVIEVGEAWRLLDFIAKRHQLVGDKAKDVRDALIFLLMLDAGLRVGELVKLQVGDLLFADKPVTTLEVRTLIAKNHHPRSVPLSQAVQTSIESMNRKIWMVDMAVPADNAFYTVNPLHRISTRQVQRILKSAGVIALGKKVTPHMLRHTFATRLMTKTDIRTIQVLLGHASLASTQIYTHPNSKNLRDAIDAMDNPTGE